MLLRLIIMNIIISLSVKTVRRNLEVSFVIPQFKLGELHFGIHSLEDFSRPWDCFSSGMTMKCLLMTLKNKLTLMTKITMVQSLSKPSIPLKMDGRFQLLLAINTRCIGAKLVLTLSTCSEISLDHGNTQTNLSTWSITLPT